MSGALSPWAVRLVTVGGLGRLRPASGTWGSLPPVVLAGALIAAGVGPGCGGDGSAGCWAGAIAYHAVLVGLAAVFTLACAVFGDAAEARFGHDPAEVVADETAGQCLPLLLLPAGAVSGFWPAAATLAGAFVAFRAFDIIKPWPARRLQRVPGGWGIVLDDLAAGVQAMLAVQVVTRLAV